MNIEKPKELDRWYFGDIIQIPNGHYVKLVPDLTRDNFVQLIEEHNRLVILVNHMAEKMGILPDE